MRNQPVAISFSEQHCEPRRTKDRLPFCDPSEFIEARYKHCTVINDDRFSLLYLIFIATPCQLEIGEIGANCIMAF